jgi:hypothetical protein
MLRYRARMGRELGVTYNKIGKIEPRYCREFNQMLRYRARMGRELFMTYNKIVENIAINTRSTFRSKTEPSRKLFFLFLVLILLFVFFFFFSFLSLFLFFDRHKKTGILS